MRRKFIPSTSRVAGRHLRTEQQQLLEEELPKWQIRLVPEGKQEAIENTQLEIGFGQGEHLIHRAQMQPNVQFIGCEVYIPCLTACLRSIKEQKIKNVQLFTEDARLLLEALPEASLERVYILFPDPWPKVRHHKRRIVNQETLKLVHRVLKPDGELRFATDHPEYAAWMLAQVQAHGGFAWTAETKADWQHPPEGHVITRYQQKLKAGHEPVFFSFIRH